MSFKNKATSEGVVNIVGFSQQSKGGGCCGWFPRTVGEYLGFNLF